MKFSDLIYEDDSSEKKSMFQRAKSLALRVAKTSGRSDNTIKKSQNVSDLEQAVSGWKDAKDTKLKSGYNSIKNTLKNTGKDNADNSDKENTENRDSTENSSIEDTIKKDTENLSPDKAEKYELAVKQEQNDIERISDKLEKNLKKRKESIESMNSLIDSLLSLIAPDAKIDSKDNDDKADKIIDQLNNVNDFINEFNEYKESIEQDYKDKLEAQETMLKNIEKKYKNKNCPEVDKHESTRKKNIEQDIETEMYKNPILKDDIEKYRYLLQNELTLSDDDRKELEQLRNGKVGKIINDINAKYKSLTNEEKEQMNKKWFDEQTKSTRELHDVNIVKLKNSYKKKKKKFEESSKDLISTLKKFKENTEKEITLSDEELKNTSNAMKEFKNVLNSILKSKDDDDDIE